jgi:hypothetical protein
MNLPKKQHYMQRGEKQPYLDSEGMKQLADEIDQIQTITIMSYKAQDLLSEIKKFLRGD